MNVLLLAAGGLLIFVGLRRMPRAAGERPDRRWPTSERRTVHRRRAGRAGSGGSGG
ncbi:hypothetical protein ACFQY7_42175 [Actinomadura luteofluorescens]|uniref:hypothetical protein n=1 Tax=Actinomadura luteofluorescens TaxID=46163 RepID=UPI00362E87FD